MISNLLLMILIDYFDVEFVVVTMLLLILIDYNFVVTDSSLY